MVGQCASGFYCNATNPTTVPNPAGYECPVGFYCPQGSESPLPCPSERMSIADNQRQQSDCRGCQPGYVCKFGEGRWYICPAGSYCPPQGPNSAYTKVEYKCPAGTYNPSTGMVYLSDCLLCEAGHYCPEEGMKKPGPLCPKGSFCPEATISPITCTGGTFLDYEGAQQEDECLQCPIGSYCTEGASAPIVCRPGQTCPLGTKIP
jgi:hypothetical protein